MAERNRLQPDLAFVKGVMEAGGETVNRCYQCATCSVVCPLSTTESPFPRKEMLWAQWGLASRVSGDADVWLCHQCGDCTTYCPRDARPGDVLGAIRNNAIRYYARPRGLADMLSKPAGVVGAIIASMIVVLVVAALWSKKSGQAFPIPEGTIAYHNFLSVIPIDAIYMPLALFVVFAILKGVIEFWKDISDGAGLPRSFTGTVAMPALGPLLTKYIWPSVLEILNHERFKKCGATKERATGHLWLLWAFLILFFVTNFVFIAADVFGMHTPMSLFHPVKILANIGAVMMVAGIWMLKTMRDQKTADGTLSSSVQDWILIWLIFAVAVTGIGAELLRLVNVAVVAYPVYVLHLGCVAVLFLAVPYTKFGHLVYRTTAYVFDRWARDVKAGKAGFGFEKPVGASDH
jgi:quinone-modifying oxidoreductase subunit QmoC